MMKSLILRKEGRTQVLPSFVKKSIYRVFSYLLIATLILGMFPMAVLAAESNSEYAVCLGASELASGYRECYTGKLTLGSGDTAITVDKTYVLSFQEDSFSVTNKTGKIISTKLSWHDYTGGLTSTAKNLTATGTRTSKEIEGFNPNFVFTDSKILTQIGYPQSRIDAQSTKYYFMYFNYAGTSSNHIDMKYALLIEITQNGTKNVDKNALSQLITSAKTLILIPTIL